MKLPRVTTREEWLAEREALRAKEEALAETLMEVTAERRRLPMVEITQQYALRGPDGVVDLLDLFAGRSQLIVYHFWFESGEEPCKGCSLWVSNLCPLENLHAADTSLSMVSRATPAEIETVKEQRG